MKNFTKSPPKEASTKDLVRYINDFNKKGYESFDIKVNPFEVNSIKLYFMGKGVSIKEFNKDYLTFVSVSWNKNNLKIK